jgi:hypothetical protein
MRGSHISLTSTFRHDSSIVPNYSENTIKTGKNGKNNKKC